MLSLFGEPQQGQPACLQQQNCLMALQEAFVAALPATLAVMERAHAAARAAAAWVVQVRHTHPRAGMYPLDLSVAAGAQRAQFLSWAFPTDT